MNTSTTRPGASTLRPQATGVGQNGSVCLQNNTFTQPLGTAAVFIPASVAGLTLLSNGFGNMGKAEALVKGVVNVAYLFTAGNIFYEHTNNNPGATFLDGKALIAPAIEGVHSVELANACIYSTLTDSTVTAPGQLHLSIVRGGSNTGTAARTEAGARIRVA